VHTKTKAHYIPALFISASDAFLVSQVVGGGGRGWVSLWRMVSLFSFGGSLDRREIEPFVSGRCCPWAMALNPNFLHGWLFCFVLHCWSRAVLPLSCSLFLACFFVSLSQLAAASLRLYFSRAVLWVHACTWGA